MFHLLGAALLKFDFIKNKKTDKNKINNFLYHDYRNSDNQTDREKNWSERCKTKLTDTINSHHTLKYMLHHFRKTVINLDWLLHLFASISLKIRPGNRRLLLRFLWFVNDKGNRAWSFWLSSPALGGQHSTVGDMISLSPPTLTPACMQPTLDNYQIRILIVFLLYSMRSMGTKYCNWSRGKLEFKGSSGKDYGTHGLN